MAASGIWIKTFFRHHFHLKGDEAKMSIPRRVGDKSPASAVKMTNDIMQHDIIAK